ncbi:hypothetical protein HUT11_35690 (plasmid) [Streptomyces seoulensis]|nr:hypothetical protein HUT11_35690 [Streptomyces seoulensis]
MSAETISMLDSGSTNPQAITLGDGAGGGAGRGGSQNSSQGPLVVVQQPRSAAPPRPAPRRSRDNEDNSLRNGYAAISHSVSGETAAIGLGFLAAGPIGAIIGGVAAPAVLAAVMWRSRRAEHDNDTNKNNVGNTSRDSSGSGAGNGGRNSNGGRRNGPHHNSPGGGRHRTPNGHGTDRTGNHRKPKVKDPVADKLSKLGKELHNKLKDRNQRDKTPKNGKHDGAGKPPGSGSHDSKGAGKNHTAPKNATDLKGGTGKDRKWLKDRGPQSDSDRPWRSRGPKGKPEKPRKDKRGKNTLGDDTTSATARDGLEPKKPNGGGGAEEEVFDAEIVDDGLPPKPDKAPGDVIDGEVIDEDRIALVRTKRERAQRRQAITAGKEAAQRAARDGDMGDPHQVKADVIREYNRRIDLELHHENERLALTAAAEKPRSTPVNYPAIQATPTRTAGTVMARQIDFRGSTAYALLHAMADQLAHGLYNDDAADMADHIVELTGIPNMCKNLSLAVQEAARALARTAPLHPSVIKHLNNAAIAARSAGVMADQIMVVFVQAHREDIIRVLDPRIGEERWNLRNGPGTLDAAKLRAAIASAHSARLTLPSGASPAGDTPSGGSKLVPASDGSTKKLITLMKGFTRGHMVNVLSEVAGSAAGVEVVADSVTKLYRRMVKTWPTEGVVDDTVRATASKVRTISTELRKAIKAAQRAHQRELRLNEKPRKGARAEKKWDVVGRGPAN